MTADVALGAARPAGSTLAWRPASAVSFWCFVAFTFILFTAPQAFFPALAPWRPAMVAGAIAAVTYLLGALASGRPIIVPAPEARLIVGLTVLALLSMPFSRWPGGSMSFFQEHFVKSVIIFFLAAHLVDTLPRMMFVFKALVGIGVVLAASAIRDFSTGTLALDGVRIEGHVAALSLDPNDLALTLNLFLGLAIGLRSATSRPGARLVLLAVVGVLAAGVVVSFSRGGFLTLAVIMGITLARAVRRHRVQAFLPLLVALPLMAFLLPAGYTTRLYSLFDFDYDRSGSAQSRLAGMTAALVVMLENPVFGVGLGMDVLAMVDKGLGWGETHSAYLQIGADLGLPGLVVYVLLLREMVRGFRALVRRPAGRPAERQVHALAVGLQTAVWGYAVGAFFLSVPYNSYLYYIAGFGVALRGIAERAADRRGPVPA